MFPFYRKTIVPDFGYLFCTINYHETTTNTTGSSGFGEIHATVAAHRVRE
jgi:hypothetical protein